MSDAPEDASTAILFRALRERKQELRLYANTVPVPDLPEAEQDDLDGAYRHPAYQAWLAAKVIPERPEDPPLGECVLCAPLTWEVEGRRFMGAAEAPALATARWHYWRVVESVSGECDMQGDPTTISVVANGNPLTRELVAGRTYKVLCGFMMVKG